FQIQGFNINPANVSLFPWLSQVVNGNFQEWEPSGMLVELKSLASDFAQNLSLGSMFMCVYYNADDAPPANKSEVENCEYAMSEKVSCNLLMPIECSPANDALTHF